MGIDTTRVLVLDANQRSALAVTRSLGRSGRYLASTADSVTLSLAGASRYSQRYFRYPDPNYYPMDFVSWVNDVVKRHYFQLVIPTTEVTSQLLLKYQSKLPSVNLPFAPYDQVMKLADKISLLRLAKDFGIPVPRSVVFEHAGQVTEDSLQFPVVIKPALSHIFQEDHWVHTRVQVVRSLREWYDALDNAPYLISSPFLLQEYIPGHGSGIFCMYDKGKPVQFFAHQRLREKPPEGGVSVLSKSVPIDNELKVFATKLLTEVSWHGIAMVEFRISEQGTPYVMEVNTRFWGSLQLAIDSGINFPVMLANLHLGREVNEIQNYCYDQRLRWLLGDLDSLYLFLRKPHSLKMKFAQVVSFLSIRWRNQKHEVNRLDDLKPAWLELKQYVRALIR